MGARRLRVIVLTLVWTLALPPITVGAAPAKEPQPEATTLSADGSTPLPVPEDPLGLQSEQQTPDISISVDVRDGHLVARVVDIWGPGRVPLVVRSYVGGWQFNHHLDVQPTGDATSALRVRESDGTLSTYKFSTTRAATGDYKYYVYVKNIGQYATIEALIKSWSEGPRGDKSFYWSWDGNYTQYLPKGAIRFFSGPPVSGADSPAQVGWARVIQEKDANDNAASYAATSLPEQDHPYIATVTDPVGRVTTYGYESYNRVCVERNERNFCLRYVTYYRVKTATDPYGRVVTYTYTSGRLTSAINAAGFTTQYGYDAGGRLNSVTNARGFTTTIVWTGTTPARVSKVTVPDGAETSYTYTGNPVTKTVVTDARGKQSTYEMSNDDVVKVTDPLLNVTQFAYDSRHNVTQVTDTRTPGVVTAYAYNSHNRVTQIVQVSGTLNLTTDLSWDSVDALPYNGKDNLRSVTDPRRIRTEYAYDTKNNLLNVKRAVGTADEALTQYTYNTWGGVASVIDPRGNSTTYTYTARRQIQTITPLAGGPTSFTYNAVDDQVTMADGNAHTWTTAYDARRLVTSVTDPLNNQIHHEYDANGNRTRTSDAKNQATPFAYDNRDRLTSITDPVNSVTSYAYDPVGNLIRITNARNHSSTFTYDEANRLTQVADGLGQVTVYGYDAVGNRTSMRDRKSVTHTYTYDQVNRLTQVSSGGTTISYTYDANGNRLGMTDPTGTTQYAYDFLDRLIRATHPDTKSVQFVYDKAGNRTRLTYPGGTATLDYAYDAANRLAQVTQGTLQWTFGYDSAGNRTQLTQPNGTTTAYAYLNNNWLSSITHRAPGGAAFETIAYTYDSNGNRLTQTDSSGTTIFGYDALNRLTQAAYPGTYGTWSWTYDAVGNRTSQTAPGGPTTYTYDQNNRLTQAGVVVYSYDPNGNLTGTTAGQTFSYDPFNRMIQAVSSGGTATYTYNGDGLKIQRVGPDGATRYYHDGIRPVWETDGAGTMTAQLDRDIFGNLLSRREASGTRRYYHPDGLGSTIALSDEAGGVAASMLYDAWGNVRANSGAGYGRYKFTGTELDEASGLYHMGARFYDPAIGRWLSEDPVQNRHFKVSALNFYAYAGNNPLIYVDPDGQAIVLAPALLGLVLVGGFIVMMGTPEYQRALQNVLKIGPGQFADFLDKLWERIWNSAMHHAKPHDFEKVRAQDAGHVQEMKQEIKNLDRLIEAIKEALSSGRTTEEQGKLEKALEAAKKLRDAYQEAVDAAEASP